MPAQEQNYWLETINAPSVEAAPDLPENVDVAIVGGGFCGLSAARALAKRGVRAAVLEAETFGWGASCRNGGMVLSAALIEREFRHQLRIVPQGHLRSEIGSHIYFGGMVDETSAGVNPARYVTGLAHAAERAGAWLHDHTRVEEITAESQNGARKFRVRTSRGSIAAREVILASGAYTTETTPALRKKIIPIGSYIIATEVLPADLAHELSPRNRMIYDSKHFLYYYRLTPDNRMLFGGRAAFFPATESTVRQSAEILRRGMITVYPQLCDTKIEYGWGGTLDFTLDVMPHAGKMDEMYFAVGFAGHGVAAATWFGTKLAEMISGNINSIPFAELPFPAAPIGLRSGRTWALPLAGLWYRILDFFT